MKFNNFMNCLSTNLIPPKIQSWTKFVALNSCSKSHISLNTRWIPTDEGSKFKLDYLESKYSYILLIDLINLKFGLINFVYFFRHPVVL